MNHKTKQNLYALGFAILIFITLFFLSKLNFKAALGPAFLAFLIWNNILRKDKKDKNQSS
jgi:4-amino-4-deoxy-L-arabinose transferase-like glycosyltransferase